MHPSRRPILRTLCAAQLASAAGHALALKRAKKPS
jgi:hypothetical protein